MPKRTVRESNNADMVQHAKVVVLENNSMNLCIYVPLCAASLLKKLPSDTLNSFLQERVEVPTST